MICYNDFFFIYIKKNHYHSRHILFFLQQQTQISNDYFEQKFRERERKKADHYRRRSDQAFLSVQLLMKDKRNCRQNGSPFFNSLPNGGSAFSITVIKYDSQSEKCARNKVMNDEAFYYTILYSAILII